MFMNPEYLRVSMVGRRFLEFLTSDGFFALEDSPAAQWRIC